MTAAAGILVTGASGFVGTAVCAELVRRGWKVRAAVRSPQRLMPDGCEPAVIGDLADDPPWDAALRDIDVVIHLAALVHQLGPHRPPDARYLAVNAVASERLARAAATAGVRRLVFLSSVKVNGESTPYDRPFTADDVPHPQDPYARSKWQAERALQQVATETGIEVVVLRSPLVYGPGVGANFLRLVRLIQSGLPLPLRGIRNRRSLIYVANLADLIAACARHPAASGRTLMASDGDDLATPDLAKCIGDSLGKTPLLLSVPPALLRALGGAIGRSAEVARLVDSLAVDSSETGRLLQWRAPFTAAQGIGETVRWLRRNSLARSA